jgi:hypothetical protein
MTFINNHVLYNNIKPYSLGHTATLMSAVPISMAPKTLRLKMFKMFARLFLSERSNDITNGFNARASEMAKALEAAYWIGFNSGKRTNLVDSHNKDQK